MILFRFLASDAWSLELAREGVEGDVPSCRLTDYEFSGATRPGC